MYYCLLIYLYRGPYIRAACVRPRSTVYSVPEYRCSRRAGAAPSTWPSFRSTSGAWQHDHEPPDKLPHVCGSYSTPNVILKGSRIGGKNLSCSKCAGVAVGDVVSSLLSLFLLFCRPSCPPRACAHAAPTSGDAKIDFC